MGGLHTSAARREGGGRRRRAAVVAVGTLAATMPVVALATPASAATFTVSNTNDAGPGSFRQAVLDANGSPGADVIAINLAAGSTIVLSTGEIASSEGLTINGPSGGVTIRQSTANARVLNNTSGSTLVISNVSFTGSSSSVTGGGGVIQSIGDVSLANGTVTKGLTDGVGGGIATGGSLSLTKVTLTANQNGGGAPGGGFFAAKDLTVVSSTITGNTAGGAGGGGVADGTATISDTTVSGNTATLSGGGLGIGHDTTVSGGSIADNTAGSTGGGLFVNDGSATYTQVSVTGNKALGTGAGGLYAAGGTITLTRSLVNGNLTPGSGGGVAAEGGITVTNSTVSSNGADTGGGLFSGGPVNLQYATVAGNNAATTANIRTIGITKTSLPLKHASAIVPAAAPFTSFGSVVALPFGGGENCTTGAQTSSGYNFENGGATCGFTQTGDTSNGADPLLGALADNTGPTKTHLPGAGSPLVNKIPAGSSCTGTDQRLIPRPQMNTCDIGAVEVRTPAAGDGFLTTTVNTPVSGDIRNYITDPDHWLNGGTWSAQPASNGGLTTLGDGGGFTYTPDTGFAGTDSFPYTVCDVLKSYCTPNATVTIAVTGTAVAATVTPTFTG